ncbi:LysR family transcriptional regulator [Luteibacter aegosomatissinici]|uniref:LysR family transcriptional regulator n=1 Tax=Luteibacter aegosomatissinici TaxID=2911539 RepID=UPI001FFBDDCA|nr:LysR family transcriptional regulator [Luteibacter aegosomatissinici]UPG92574.1 LysR family transcriptional regulator [Luteibacter aegosomatissinici]
MDRLTCMGVFEAAARTGSIAGAARLFAMTPSRASKYLAALEAELGVSLLRRSTRQLALTPEGERYLERCRRVLAEVREADDEARAQTDAISGTLRVTAPVTFGALHLGPVVAAFLQKHPGVSLQIQLDDRYRDLRSDAVDVAIRIGRLASSSLVARRLGACHMVLCAAPSFLANHATVRTPADLAGLPVLAFSEAVSPADWMVRDAAGALHRIEGTMRLAADNVQMLAAAAVAGAGLVFGPTFILGPHIQRGELVRVLPAYEADSLDISVVYSTRAFLPRTVRAFVDHLAGSLKEPFAWGGAGVQAASR